MPGYLAPRRTPAFRDIFSGLAEQVMCIEPEGASPSFQ